MGILEGILYMMWRGLAIGIIISAPMGPVGILCVQRTLEKGRASGLFTGIGAALSDIIYCLLTGFGLSFIEDFLKANQDAIQIIGSVVLIIFGVYLFKSNPARTLKKPEEQKVSKRRTIASGFLFTFSNPLIIFLIIGLFARFNFLLPEISVGHYLVGYAFIFIGALLWWYVITLLINKVRAHFNLRSMWVVNKITGAIIVIFGLVGIITAVSNLASASDITPHYYSSARDFGCIDDPQRGRGEPLVINNERQDTIVRFLPLEKAEEFSFSFRAANMHNASGKSYHYSADDGKRKILHPAWGVRLMTDAGEYYDFILNTIDDHLDAWMPTRLRVTKRKDGVMLGAEDVKSGIEMFDLPNSFRILSSGGKVYFTGGDRQYSHLSDIELTTGVDSIGFLVAPGASLQLDHISMEINDATSKSSPEYSRFITKELRDSYFQRSMDQIEGEYMIFDRQIDTDRLRIGGEYHMAIVRDENTDGYTLIYLDGAQKNASKWKAGMVKGDFIATPFKNIYDVRWLDPAGSPLEGAIKAQISDDLITMQFEQYGSSMRLRKIK